MIYYILTFAAGLLLGITLAAWQITKALDSARNEHAANDRLNPFKRCDPQT